MCLMKRVKWTSGPQEFLKDRCLQHVDMMKLLSGGTNILHTPKPSHCRERSHDDSVAERVHGAAPGLVFELAQVVETSPEPGCKSNHVTDKSVQVRLLTRHEASQANEEKILSRTAMQTEPLASSAVKMAAPMIRVVCVLNRREDAAYQSFVCRFS
ncbi:hypothetical protein MRX96_027679 [Rhipicephalus microplus]